MGKPLGTYSAYLAPRYRGNAGDYLASLRRLRALPVPDLVLPGHPGADPTPQSPSLSPRRWNALLDDGIREMEILAARYRADGPDFLDGVPKALLPELYYLGDFGGTAVYGFFAGSRFFLVGAGGQPGLVAFVKARLRQLGREPADPAAVLLTSGGRGVRAGLREIVENCRADVVGRRRPSRASRTPVPPARSFSRRRSCRAEDGSRSRRSRCGGRRFGPMAYLLEWAGKTVLLTGRKPVKVTPQSVDGLAADIGESKADWQHYQASLADLGGIRPDLWLPATPVDGQNANLYGDEWQAVIVGNGNVARFMLSRVKLKSDDVKESEQDSK